MERIEQLSDELDTLCQAIEGHRAGALTNDGLWHYVEKARALLRVPPSPHPSETLKAARKALMCLYIAVESDIADDVNRKVEAAFAELLAASPAGADPRVPPSPSPEIAVAAKDGHSAWWVCFRCWRAFYVPTTGYFGPCDECGKPTQRWPADPSQTLSVVEWRRPSPGEPLAASPAGAPPPEEP